MADYDELLKELRAAALPFGDRPRPTIAELEAILSRDDDPGFEIMPDGEIRATSTLEKRAADAIEALEAELKHARTRALAAEGAERDIAKEAADFEAEKDRLRGIEGAARALHDYYVGSLHVGPGKFPSRESPLWRNLHIALAPGDD